MSDKPQDRSAPFPASGMLPRKRSRSGSEKRERDCIIKVRAKKEERDEMRANAAAAGLSLSSFIRSVAHAEKLAGAIFDLIDPPTKPRQGETERSLPQEERIVPAPQPRLLDFSSYTRQPEQEAMRERGERER